jgi:hypothetical protein
MGHGRPPGNRKHPRRSRLVPVPRRRGPGHLRREGQEPAQPPVELLRAAGDAAERTYQMVQTADHVEWIVAKNEVEAFFLEFNLIKRHKPRFNIRLKDDKSYPYLAVTLDEEWPRAMVMRGQEAQGRALLRAVRARVRDPRDPRPPAAHVPDPHVHELEVRPASSPRPAVPLRAHREVRGAVRRRHRPRRVHEARAGADRLPRRRARRGRRPARADARARPTQLEFELAARVRDQLASVHKAIERQQMVGTREEDYDLIGLAEDPLEASVQLFFVRKGSRGRAQGPHRRQGRRRRDAGARRAVIEQLYADAPAGRRAEGDPRAGRARRPRALRGVPRAQPRVEGAHPRAAARRQARAARDRDAQRARERSRATS